MSEIDITSTDILALFKPDDASHMEALVQMRELFQGRSNDSELARFLIARKFDVAAAAKMLNDHFEWKSVNRKVVKSDCLKSLSLKHTFCHGQDLQV